MNREEYKLIREKYLNGDVIFSINLDKARKVLFDMQYKPILFFYFAILILMLSCCIYSFFALKWFGILYSAIFPLIWFSFMGTCSLPKQQVQTDNIIWVWILSVLISYMLFSFNVTVLVFLSFLTLFLTYYIYQFAGKTIITNFILADIKWFNILLNDVFFVTT